MFKISGRNSDPQSSLMKFLDHNKDSFKRLKGLQKGLEKSSAKEAKKFYDRYHSTVFFTFYASFTTIETGLLGNRGTKSSKARQEAYLKDLMEVVLPALERIIILLPEMINKRWQYHSICLIIRKLLHPENTLDLRKYGIKLLILWIHTLQESIDDSCLELFKTAIPHFPPPLTPMGLPSSSSDSSVVNPSVLSSRFGSYGMISSTSLSNSTFFISAKSPSPPHTSPERTLPGTVGIRTIYPLAVAGTQQQLSDEQSCIELMDFMLQCISSQVGRLQWKKLSQHLKGFSFVFYQFKLHYLASLYKTFRDSACLYSQPSTPVLDPAYFNPVQDKHALGTTTTMPEFPVDQPDGLSHQKLLAEASVDNQTAVASAPAVNKRHMKCSSTRVSEVIKLDFDLSHPVYRKLKLCILRWVLHCMEQCDLLVRLKAIPSTSGSGGSPTPYNLMEGDIPSGEELICEMWYTSRDNVNLLLEICRQGMMASQSDGKFSAGDMQSVILLYKSWVQAESKPLFMQEEGALLNKHSVMELATPPQGAIEDLDNKPPAIDIVDSPHISPTASGQNDDHTGDTSCEMTPKTTSNVSVDSNTVAEVLDSKVLGEITSTVVSESGSCVLISAWEAIASYATHEAAPVGAGLQASLRMFISHTAQVFLIKQHTVAKLDKLVDVCREVILLYQDMATEWKLDPVSWENLLSTLLQLTQHLLKDGPPKIPGSTLGSQLVSIILKTLLVSWIRASMVTKVTAKLWDQLLNVLSSLTSWREVIIEWKNTLILMTRVVAQVVYQLDLDELPLKKLEKHQNKGQAAKGQAGKGRSYSNVANVTSNRRKTFSQGLLLKSNIIGKSHPMLQRNNSTKRERCLSSGNTPTLSHRMLNPSAKLTSESQLGDMSNEPLLVDSMVSLVSESSRSYMDRQSSTSSSQQQTAVDGGERRSSEPTAAALIADHPLLTQTYSAPPVSSNTPSPVTTHSPLVVSEQKTPWSGNESPIALKQQSTSSAFISSSLKGGDFIVTNEHADTTVRPHTPSSVHESSPSGSRRTSENICTTPEPKRYMMKAFSVDDTRQKLLNIESSGNCLLSSPDNFSSDILPDRSGSIKVRKTRGSVRYEQPIAIHEEKASSGERSTTGLEDEDAKASEEVTDRSTPEWASPGWTMSSACTIWKRMLGVLGNISQIKDPRILAEAVKCIEEVWKKLMEIDSNLGVSEDNSHTPPRPELLPPLLLFAPWLFQVCQLPLEFVTARHIACRLLCCMFLRHTHYPQPTAQYLQHFHQLFYSAIQPGSDIQEVAVRYGSHIFTHVLPGSTLLIRACVRACKDILTSHSNQSPRVEALTLLASLHLHPDLYRVGDTTVKNEMVEILFTAARTEPSQQPRCLALFQLGLVVFSDLMSCKPSSYLMQGLDILLGTLQFPDLSILLATVDVITMFTSVAPQMRKLFPDMPASIIQQLCLAISSFLNYNVESHHQALVALMLCLRDWMMVLPLSEMQLMDYQGTADLLKMVFRVIQSALFSQRVRQEVLTKLATQVVPPKVSILGLAPNNSTSRSQPLSEHSLRSMHHRVDSDDSGDGKQLDPVTIAAKSVLNHLLSFLGHFPFHCGAAQLGSNVAEYHDSPSLQYLDELSTDIFDSPRVQFFIYNNSSIISCVEIPTKDLVYPFLHCSICLSSQLMVCTTPEDQSVVQIIRFNGCTGCVVLASLRGLVAYDDPAMDAGLPGSVLAGHLECRIIVRDITGKYVWDSAVLHGLQCEYDLPVASAVPVEIDGCNLLESASSCGVPSLDDSYYFSSSPAVLPDDYKPVSTPPTWQTHTCSRDGDILDELLQYVQQSSPECISHVRVGLNNPAPCNDANLTTKEDNILRLLERETANETQHHQATKSLPTMSADPAKRPDQVTASFAYHYCKLVMSHFGMFSWEQRPHLNLLEKTDQLIRELKHLDARNTQCRQTYKVAVMYVEFDQEDRESILRNTSGSRDFEDFVAGLGWEVDQATHRGYMGGLEFKSTPGATAPYFATSSEEIFFHVSTRMLVTDDLSHKIRHIGNDEVHIVWSAHWRDYRRSIFKTQFGDVLIIIYPLPNHLYRIHIIKKPDVPQFGPLFDGAIVDHVSLPVLVRTTAINALRARRDIHMTYRGRYEDRARCIKSIVKKMKRRLCFEDFAIHCMHPMELVMSPSHVSTRENTTSHVSTSSSTPVPQLGVSPPAASVLHPHGRPPGIPKVFSGDASLLPTQDGSTEANRPRAHTYSYKKEVLDRIARKDLQLFPQSTPINERKSNPDLTVGQALFLQHSDN